MQQVQKFKCEACGEEFEHSPSDPAFGDNIWCDECYQEYCMGFFEMYDSDRMEDD